MSNRIQGKNTISTPVGQVEVDEQAVLELVRKLRESEAERRRLCEELERVNCIRLNFGDVEFAVNTNYALLQLLNEYVFREGGILDEENPDGSFNPHGVAMNVGITNLTCICQE